MVMVSSSVDHATLQRRRRDFRQLQITHADRADSGRLLPTGHRGCRAASDNLGMRLPRVSLAYLATSSREASS